MTELPSASPLFALIFFVAVAAAFFAWGSWHGRRYTAKHERAEAAFSAAIKRIEQHSGDKLKALEDELAKIQSLADEKKAELEAAVRRRFGG